MGSRFSNKISLPPPVIPPDHTALQRSILNLMEGARRLVERLLVDTAEVLGYLSDAVDRAAEPTSRSLAWSLDALKDLARVNHTGEKTRFPPWVIPAAIALLALLY